MEFTYENRLVKVEERSKSNTHRIDKLEESTEAINRLAVSIQVMAEKQDYVANTVDKLDSKVTALEQKPLKRWDSLAEKSIWAVLAAIITFLLGHFGL